MTCKRARLGFLPTTAAVLLSCLVWSAARRALAGQPDEVVQFKGGLVVQLGCGDGKLTAAMGTAKGCLGHALDTDPENVERARRHIRSMGIYGQVSVDAFDGQTLPYADNLVNLLVAEELGDVSRDEVMRVLAPGAAALVGSKVTVKPWPGEIDQWTHHLHDAGGNAVADDSLVGPPRHLRWTAGPRWARSHGWTPSVSAMVSAGGRLFYICDETLTGVDASVPDKWVLAARDAFSGVLLWKRSITPWGSPPLSGTPNTGAGVTTGRFTMPTHVGKRLLAVDDTVYVTLGADQPVTAVHAATGKPRRVYPQTARADEILYTGGRLIVSINPAENSADAPPAKQVCAIQADSGRLLWRKGPFSGIRASRGQDPFGRLELAAGDGRVLVLTTEAIECLSADSGKRLWRTDRPALPADAVRRIGFAGMFEYLLTVMVYHDGVVLLAQPEPNTHHTYHTMPGTLYAFDAADGRQMWKHGYGGWGHCTPPDVFVVGDAVWTHVDAQTEFGSSWGGGFRAKDTGKVDYRIQALDLRTGRLRKEIATREIFNVGHHHRCYRNKITERFMMSSRRGVEFVDLASGENQQHHWVRSGCLLGHLPCNGLLYVTPHPCGCYLGAKLTGFNALAAGGGAGEEKRGEEREERAVSGERRRDSTRRRLLKGPAYGGDIHPSSLIVGPSEDWPTYRHDGRRSGATQAAVAAELGTLWTAKLGCRPSGLVVAGGKVLVAEVDAHTVHALDAERGKCVWKYTAGARVDSPPTLHRGLAIFGSADGRAYCLRASDGALVWRFNAAPRRRLVTAYEQLESPWPVHGSVLVHRGKCYFAAGRSSYLDGGIHLFALDPATGSVDHQQTIYHGDPETGKMSPVTDGHAMPGLLGDVPGTDGADVFIRQMNVSSPGRTGRRHLFTTAGYLDPSWFNRTYWKVGPVQTSGIMVMAGDRVYGVEIYASRSRETVFKPGSEGYRLTCYSLTESAAARPAAQPKRRARARPGRKAIWQQQVPIRITAMVRTAEKLFVAGSPDVVDPADPHGAWEGRKGGVLAVFDAADGRKLDEVELAAPPVWDGMAVAGGRLLVSTTDGRVVCLAGAK